MRTLDRAGAGHWLLCKHALHTQPLKALHRQDHIHDGVDRAHFVKVDLLRCAAMDAALRNRDAHKHRLGTRTHCRRHLRASQDLANLFQPAMHIGFGAARKHIQQHTGQVLSPHCARLKRAQIAQ